MKRISLLVGAILVVLLPTGSHAGVGNELNGLGSFGISLGAMKWVADSDARYYGGDEFGEGGSSQPRPIGKAVFRYRIDTTWAVSIETGFGWNSYPDSDELVLWVIPTTVGLERRLADVSSVTTSLCFGAGLYVWGERRHGDFLKDTNTQQDYHAADPGVFLGYGGEVHLAKHVTVTGILAAHYIYSAHKDDFTARLGGDDVFTELRIGINYYFSPFEGLIAEDSD